MRKLTKQVAGEKYEEASGSFDAEGGRTDKFSPLVATTSTGRLANNVCTTRCWYAAIHQHTYTYS